MVAGVYRAAALRQAVGVVPISRLNARLKAKVLAAYRWQYIGSGVRVERFSELLGGMIDTAQAERIAEALAPVVA